MAVFTTKAFDLVKPVYLPCDGGPEWTVVDVEFKSTNYVPGNTDFIKLVTIPDGYFCLDWFLSFPDIDSNGTPTLAWSLGLSNATIASPVATDIGTEVWGSGLTAGQSTAIVRNTTSVSAQGRRYATSTLSGDKELILKCTTAAATYAGANQIGRVGLLLVR